jgi:L-alanine-DL-glutamate epimerase-like enolase superfamily enzyme
VAASAFDAALHDAFGKANAIHSYAALGRDFVGDDLGGFLDGSFAGKYLDQYALPQPKESLSLYHLVGALDPLTAAEVKKPVGDGLPETLYEWIGRDGLTHLKIKLNGDDLDWDVERVLDVSHVADTAEKNFCRRQWWYSLDFNEKCPNVEYLLEFLAQVKECRPDALERIQYIEQPTARDLKANPGNKMHRAAKIKPVVIDESLVGYESLLLAQEMGYSGVALKACKGITQSLLLGAAAQERGMFVCVQDLTCVGASFLESAGLAAHFAGVTAVEGNGRQYCPAANESWEGIFPRTFRPNAGSIDTQALSGVGLGCVPEGYEK